MTQVIEKWCRWTGSNGHDGCPSRDFKGNACLNCASFYHVVSSPNSFYFNHKPTNCLLVPVGVRWCLYSSVRHINRHNLSNHSPP